MNIDKLFEDILQGGKGDNKPDVVFDKKELAMGIKHEMEHTNDPDIAKEIAEDHLSEDPHYYSKLAKTNLEKKDESMNNIIREFLNELTGTSTNTAANTKGKDTGQPTAELGTTQSSTSPSTTVQLPDTDTVKAAAKETNTKSASTVDAATKVVSGKKPIDPQTELGEEYTVDDLVDFLLEDVSHLHFLEQAQEEDGR